MAHEERMKRRQEYQFEQALTLCLDEAFQQCLEIEMLYI